MVSVSIIQLVMLHPSRRKTVPAIDTGALVAVGLGVLVGAGVAGRGVGVAVAHCIAVAVA